MSESSERVPCPKCQAANFSSSSVCWQCGEPLKAQQGPPTPSPSGGYQPTYESTPAYAPKPQNYLVWSILATLFCCLPSGIVSIIYAAQVDSKYNAGDFAGALDASNKARVWAWVSVGLGLVAGLAYFVIGAIIGLGGAMSGYQ